MTNDVILAFPGKYGSMGPQMPLSLIYLGAALLKAGYKPKLLDMRAESYENLSLGNVKLVGISCITGPSINYSLNFARYVREQDRDVPIVWGGVHPSCQPEQTIKNDYVDIVVRGEGEITIVELMSALENGNSLDKVRGITYKDNAGKIKTNPDREFLNMDTLPFDLPYDLLNLDKYPLFKHGNIDIQTSRGCPYRCGYCFNKHFNKQRYRFKSAKLVADEVEHVVDKYHIKHVSFIDDEFFLGIARQEAMCREIIARGIDIEWNAIVRVDTFMRYDEQLCKLIVKSGLRELSFGVETASPRLLKMVGKDIQLDTVLSAAKKATSLNLKSGYLFMCGLPTETMEDLHMSMDFVDKIRAVNATAKFLFAIYTPYPGTQLYDMLLKEKEFGYTPPQRLEDWGNYDFIHYQAPWISKKYYSFLTNLATVSRFALWTFPEWAAVFPYNIAHALFSGLAKTRWNHRFFKFPIEAIAAKKWRDRKSF